MFDFAILPGRESGVSLSSEIAKSSSEDVTNEDEDVLIDIALREISGATNIPSPGASESSDPDTSSSDGNSISGRPASDSGSWSLSDSLPVFADPKYTLLNDGYNYKYISEINYT